MVMECQYGPRRRGAKPDPNNQQSYLGKIILILHTLKNASLEPDTFLITFLVYTREVTSKQYTSQIRKSQRICLCQWYSLGQIFTFDLRIPKQT